MTTAVATRDEAPAFELATYLSQLSKPAALEAQRRLAAAYDEACHALLGPNDVQRGEKGRLFKKKSAWRKLARHFGISTSIVRTAHETLPSGDFLATVTARAIAPWGQAVEDVGSCCSDEETGRRKITVADAIATAATRAVNRAISDLIAVGELSAEELGRETPGADGDGVVLEPAEPGAVGTMFTDAAKAGITKQTFPQWYGEVLGRAYAGVIYEADVKPLLDAAAKRIALKAKVKPAGA